MSVNYGRTVMRPAKSIFCWRIENGQVLMSHFLALVFLVNFLAPCFLVDSLSDLFYTVWHIDDAIDSNADENHPKVSLMQADGLNQLKTNTAGRGDTGDPFPGRSNNTSFTPTSNPNSKSYASGDTFISITDISTASQNMTMEIAFSSVQSDWYWCSKCQGLNFV